MFFLENTIGQDNPITMVGRQRIPAWNSAGRPKKAKKGTFGFNFQTNNLEYWDGSRWLILRMAPESEKFTGGLGEVSKESKVASKDSKKKEG